MSTLLGTLFWFESHLGQNVARKIPQNSNTQSQAPHSPVNSVLPTPNPALSTSPTASLTGPVDIEAARARAKDVATQLARVNPSSTRPKSRFGALLPPTALNTSGVTNVKASDGQSAKLKGSSPPTATASTAPDVGAPSVARSAPIHKTVAVGESQLASPAGHEGKSTRHPSQGSEDSSTPLVTRLVDTSLTERPEDPQVGSYSVSIYT